MQLGSQEGQRCGGSGGHGLEDPVEDCGLLDGASGRHGGELSGRRVCGEQMVDQCLAMCAGAEWWVEWWVQWWVVWAEWWVGGVGGMVDSIPTECGMEFGMRGKAGAGSAWYQRGIGRDRKGSEGIGRDRKGSEGIARDLRRELEDLWPRRLWD